MAEGIVRQTVGTGERTSYLPLTLVSGAHAVTHMQGALMPLVYPYAMAELGFGYTFLGAMSGVSGFAASILQGPAGLLGRFVYRKVLIGLGNILVALSMVLIGISQNLAQFFVFNTLGRLAGSPQHPVGNSLISEWYGKRLRGTAFAINYAGANLGSILVPGIAAVLFALVGWRGTLWIFASLGILFGTLTIALIPESRKAASGGRTPHLSRDLLRALKDRNSRLVVLGSMAEAGERGLGVMTVYIPLYLRDTAKGGLGLDQAITSTLFTILLIGSVVGPLAFGRLSDFWGRRRTLSTTLVLSAISTLTFISAGHNVWLVALAIIGVGLVNYPSTSLFQALLADVAHPSVRDVAFSLYFPTVYTIGSLWTFALGLVADNFGFQTMFYITAVAPLLALPFVLAVREQVETA